MGNWEYRGQWSPAITNRRDDAPENRPFVSLAQMMASHKVEEKGPPRPQFAKTTNGSKFVQPQGPRYRPLVECPHLRAFLSDKDRAELDKIVDEQLAMPHDLGFNVELKSGSNREFRVVLGKMCETFSHWSVELTRRCSRSTGNVMVRHTTISLGKGDEKNLAVAMYLCEKLASPRKHVFLRNPFRPPAFVEAWLEQRTAKNVKLSAKVKECGGVVYLFSDRAGELAGMRPVSLFVGETEYPIKNWRDLIVKTCDELVKNNLEQLVDRATSFVCSYISDKPDNMRTAHKHTNSGLYVELYLPSVSHVNHSRELFEKCGYDLNDIALVYVSADSDYARSAGSKQKRRAGNEQVDGDLSALDPDELSKIKTVFAQHFPNGMRTTSVIDKNKFGRYYEELSGSSLRESFEFEKVLPIIGIVQDDKVFPIPETDDSAVNLVRDLVAEGHEILFYDEIYAQHSSRLDKVGVHSGALLRAMLQKLAPEAYCYGKDCLSLNAEQTIPELLVRHFAPEQVQATYDEASSWLPYVPVEKIKDWVGWDNRFQKMGERFALTERLLLDDEECTSMARIVADRINQDGYTSKWCVELPRSLQLNVDCSENVLHELFFDRYLAKDYNRKGLIITRKGEDLDIVSVCLKFCEGKLRVNKNDLVLFAHELGAGRAISIGTASNVMVRVSEDEFVAESQISFDSAAIDVKLESLVVGDFTPLATFNGYVLLPAVAGFPWNAYLLGSFCRRFSKKFRLMDGQVDGYARDGVCGAIVRMASNITNYIQLLTEAVRKGNVEQTSEAVGNFLFENKYVLRRRGMVDEVMDALMKS